MTGYQAALVNNQLKRINNIINKKIQIYKIYEKNLKKINGIEFQFTKKNEKCFFANQIRLTSDIKKSQQK